LAPLSNVVFCPERLITDGAGWPACENGAVSVNSRANHPPEPYNTSLTNGNFRNRYPSGHEIMVTNTTV